MTAAFVVDVNVAMVANGHAEHADWACVSDCLDVLEEIYKKCKNGDSEDFVLFPQDSDLCGFDKSDRKYVAAALASRRTPDVLNAVDRDWWQYRDALKRNGVRCRFLCPQHMEDLA